MIPENSVWITDDSKSYVNLAGETDEDSELDQIMTVRWNLQNSDVKEYHIYISADGEDFAYLGRTSDEKADSFDWRVNSPRTNKNFRIGPQFGHTYDFQVYAISKSGQPIFLGPYSTNGSVFYQQLIQ